MGMEDGSVASYWVRSKRAGKARSEREKKERKEGREGVREEWKKSGR